MLDMLPLEVYPFTRYTYNQPSITWTLISQSVLLYQRMQFKLISYFYLHFKSCYPKLLISQSKLSGTRKFTLRYQLFGMNFDFKISIVDCFSFPLVIEETVSHSNIVISEIQHMTKTTESVTDARLFQKKTLKPLGMWYLSETVFTKCPNISSSLGSVFLKNANHNFSYIPINF